MSARQRSLNPLESCSGALACAVVMGSAVSEPAAAQDLPSVEAIQPSSKTYPALSPDGRTLLFASGEDGRLNLNLLDLESGDTIALTETPTEDSAGAWSPDGARIVFQREDSSGDREIWLIDRTTGEEANVTNMPASREQHPAFTPDGRSVVFDSNRDSDAPDGEAENYEIYVMPIEGGQPRRLTRNDHWDMYPSFAPSGDKLVWRRAIPGDGDDPNFEVFVKDLREGSSVNISNHAGVDTTPDWSPDGEWIVFASDREGTRPGRVDLYVVRPDGSDVRRVTDGGASMAYFRPRFAPAGGLIVANRAVAGVVDMVRIDVAELLADAPTDNEG